jgi:threonine-phosphate decarboxylase
MHPQGILLINQTLKRKHLTGLDVGCEYRPCHEELEDCTFCYCPFYPCYEPDTGGYEVISQRTGLPVWACNNCILPHLSKNAHTILNELLELGNVFDDISPEDLKRIRAKVVEMQT